MEPDAEFHQQMEELFNGPIAGQLTGFKCRECRREYASQARAAAHLSKTHGVPATERKCPYCPKTLSSVDRLNQHLVIVHQKKCPHCNQEFLHLGLLNEAFEK